MNKLLINEILSRISEREAVDSDRELGDLLGGKARSTIATWRSRNSIPIEELVEYAFKKQISLDWLLTGNKTADGSLQIEAVALLLEILQGQPKVDSAKLIKLAKVVAVKWPMSKSDIELLVELVI